MAGLKKSLNIYQGGLNMKPLLHFSLTLTLVFFLESCAIRFVSEGPPSTDYVAPKLIEYVNIDYPAEVKARKIEGTVVATLHITNKGYVRAVEVESSPHPILSNLFYNSAKEWRYSPALREGIPVNATITVLHHFQIKPNRRYIF